MQVETKILLVGLWFALLFALERVRPALHHPHNTTRLGKNLSFWLANSALSLAIVLPLTAFAAENALWQRPALPMAWLADVLVMDLWIYAWHRANHRLPFLWRFHEVHHLDAHLDSTTAFRFHAGEVLLSAFARVPIIMLCAIPFAHVLMFELLVLLHTVFHHANITLPAQAERRVRRIIVTPAMHRMHHHNRQRDTDSNYGTILSLWDRLFVSYNARVFDDGMKIGVEGKPEKPLARLWTSPFMRHP